MLGAFVFSLAQVRDQADDISSVGGLTSKDMLSADGAR
jgi:hypothetical protein